jgi:hypothetical protein
MGGGGRHSSVRHDRGRTGASAYLLELLVLELFAGRPVAARSTAWARFATMVAIPSFQRKLESPCLCGGGARKK